MAAPFRTTVIEPWIDYNGHLNEGYYGVIFCDASDDLLEQLGFDETYRATQRGTFYTVESHIRFLRELALGDELRIDMRVVGADSRRLHLWHEMYREGDDAVAATQEAMVLHVDIDEVKVRPMSDELYDAVRAMFNNDEPGALPQDAGNAIRSIGPPREIEA